ncbi:hypothetical protein QFC21_006771 [Naganishia friedmannii]|uniref:Uncharacterized protein n=1 Tax=Naganishia friedmannii TaxID=89922 RepID=A0ACC2V098_9TREE|nr:hypothetical protein QFC21_006771 [Naganishia friedmannii]
MSAKLPAAPPQFTSSFIPHPLSKSHKIHLITSSPPPPPSTSITTTSTTTTTTTTANPVLLIHGLGSAASFWLPSLSTVAGQHLCAQRQVYAIDAYGHGVSDFVGNEENSLDRAAETVKGVIEYLVGGAGAGAGAGAAGNNGKVVLVGHSMSGMDACVLALLGFLKKRKTKRLTSAAAAASGRANAYRVGLSLDNDIMGTNRTPSSLEMNGVDGVEGTDRGVLLSPTLELPPANRASLSERAATVLSPEGHLQISSAVSSTAISRTSHVQQPLAAAFIKHLVLTTRAEAYAQACKNLSSHPGWAADVAQIQCEVFILGGEEDYMVPGPEIMKRAEQVPDGRGRGVIMQNVGHWGGLEVPERVAQELLAFVQGEKAGKAPL